MLPLFPFYGSSYNVALRASIGKFMPLVEGAEKPVIEFFTKQKPHNFNPGNGWVWWYAEEGTLVDIVVSRIANPDGSVLIFHFP